MSTATTTPWKSALLWALAIILTIGAAGWFAVSCGAGGAEAERPVTEEEAETLAELRRRNYEADPVAVRMILPVDGEEIAIDGYLDWRSPLLYARAPGADGDDRLIQAIPGLVATHADNKAFDLVEAPASEWTPRRMLAGGAAPRETMLDVLVSSLFTLTSKNSDDASQLAERATWQQEGIIDGDPVDVYRAPIMVESKDNAAANPEALYSIDEAGDLRRFQVNAGGSELASVDFLRDVEFDAAGLVPVDLLGGPRIDPADVDEDLAETIAEVRYANWSQSAEVEMTVPIADGQVAEAHGYIDWRTMTAYLNVADTDGYRLMLARPGGLASIGTDSDELPETLPADGWETHAIGEEDTSESFGPIETLTYRLLEMAAEEPSDAGEIAKRAALLRVDGGDEPTDVVEFPVAGDARAEAGESAFRYHISDDRLSEVEMMTHFGVASAELEYTDYPMVAIPWAVADKIG